MQPRERIIRLLLKILAHPYRFSKKDLAIDFKKSEDRIKEDLQILKNIGLHVEFRRGDTYTYAIIPEKEFKGRD